jgi:multidrug efflux system membrane fusion protein
MHEQDNNTSIPAPPPRKKMSRRASLIGAGIALVVVAGLGWLAWTLTHGDASAGKPRQGFGGRGGPPATTVGVATAERADLPVSIDALGTVAAAATVTVRPQISGVLEKILFREGQPVKAGDALAIIDPRPFDLALMQATGQLQRDEAQLDTARITLERYRHLLAVDSIARQDVDTQAALVKQLEGTVMMDRANQGTAKVNLGYTRIVAPTSGRVGLKAVDAGNIVSPTDANGIALITQTAPISVTFSIPQDQVPEVQAVVAGGTAPQVLAFDRTRSTVLDTGTFTALDNQVDVQTGTVRVKATFPNAKSTLFPNQFVNVRLQLRTVKGAVVVPVTALRHGGNGDYVYVLDSSNRTVALRPVVRGQATVDSVEIRSGLQAGEQVITEGADRLKDGAHVMLPGDKPGGPRGPGAPERARGDRPASGAADASSASRREAWKQRHSQQQQQQSQGGAAQ